jgi:all-trans-retinol 13,14-reductase
MSRDMTRKAGWEDSVEKPRVNSRFDVIVIGSGIGGLACACALTRLGRRVLVLEQHFAAGGLTQTFRRGKFQWDVGVHYLGQMGADGASRRVLDWLSGGAIQFQSVGPVYDTMHFPDGFEISFARPEAGLKLELAERFPASRSELDAFFAALTDAEGATRAVFAQRAMPRWIAKAHNFCHAKRIQKWCGRSTATVLREMIADPKLRAVLAGQRGDYCPDPTESSFGMHALIMRHYLEGAYYPVNGSRVFAEALVPVIENGGGEVRTRAQVTELIVEDGAVAGVRLKDGALLHCPRVFSDVGAHNTVMRLLPLALRDSPWAREVAAFKPSACHIGLYLGLQGGISACGATSSNHWFYESWDLTDGLWRDPIAQPTAPAIFVSFPSLKDGRHAHDSDQHTAEIVAFTDWQLFQTWEGSTIGRRPEQYLELKRVIEENLLAQFRRRFPALAPLIVRTELSTPLSTVAFTGAEHGGIYGLETSPRRLLSASLRPKTPVPGLYLTGQDVGSPGITGAMMGGVLAAATTDPRVLAHLG